MTRKNGVNFLHKACLLVQNVYETKVHITACDQYINCVTNIALLNFIQLDISIFLLMSGNLIPCPLCFKLNYIARY